MSDVHDRFMEHIATFNARISALTAEIACKNEALAQWKQTVGALTAENARLRAALEQVEWASSVVTELGNKFDYCPLCDQIKEKGHSPDCLVGMALDAARGRQG